MSEQGNERRILSEPKPHIEHGRLMGHWVTVQDEGEDPKNVFVVNVDDHKTH